jgi:hypothetical protein
MTKLVAISDADGMIRYRLPGPVKLKPGDEVLGVVDYDGLLADIAVNQPNELQTELIKSGIRWGDAIAWVTESVGIKGCAACKKNQELFNISLKLGAKETVRRIKNAIKPNDD